MPNRSYQRSVKREREMVNFFRAAGYIACRSAGSKSLFDVWAFHPKNKLLRLVQVKTKRGGRTTRDTNIKHYWDIKAKTNTRTWM